MFSNRGGDDIATRPTATAEFGAPAPDAEMTPLSGTPASAPADDGAASSLAPTAAARRRQQLEESLEVIPDHEKAAYLQAVQRAPHLVELESNPEQQLEFAGGDPWKAALRLTKYWASRLDVFKERAFLPLTLTGSGAMSKDDIEVLNCGFFMILPENKDGRTVLFHDRSRLPPSAALDTKMRCLFYVLSVLAESERNRRLGIVILTCYGDKTRKSTFDSKHNAKGISLIHQEILPVRVVAGHIVMLSQRPLLNMVVPMTVQLLERLNFLTSHKQVVVYKFRRLELQLQELQENGFDVEGIPKVPLGGLYSFGCFKRWVEDRHRRDSHVYGGGAPPDAFAGAAATVARSHPRTHDDETTFQREIEESKRKEADAAYARRKRHRKRIEFEVMQEEVERLKRQNLRLKDVGIDLEARLNKAIAAVEAHHRGTVPLESCTRPVPAALANEAHGAASLGTTSLSSLYSSLASQEVPAGWRVQEAADALASLERRRQESVQLQRLVEQDSLSHHAQVLQLTMAAASNPACNRVPWNPLLYGLPPPRPPPILNSQLPQSTLLDTSLLAATSSAAQGLFHPPSGGLAYSRTPLASVQTGTHQVTHRNTLSEAAHLGHNVDDHPTMLQRLYEYLSRG